MVENKKKFLIISGISIGIMILGIWYWKVAMSEEEYMKWEEDIIEAESINSIVNHVEVMEEIEEIMVHISGQVMNAGVVTLKRGARMIDAIQAVGGTTEEADLESVNLAYVLEDAQKIYIPSKAERKEIGEFAEENGAIVLMEETKNNKEEKLMININTAKEEELQKLEGIGSSTASKIVNYRKENGKFHTIEELKNVSGIGENKFNKIKDKIYVK